MQVEKLKDSNFYKVIVRPQDLKIILSHWLRQGSLKEKRAVDSLREVWIELANGAQFGINENNKWFMDLGDNWKKVEAYDTRYTSKI